jgi:hypothetical protein
MTAWAVVQAPFGHEHINGLGRYAVSRLDTTLAVIMRVVAGCTPGSVVGRAADNRQ